ncbi:MAG: sugar phosphate nucleotidyltransferase [Verrucomicrobia bacterium]|nr:sugar phosphate nucleotidyltransferase [Verrucomicrobiota bacterium]
MPDFPKTAFILGAGLGTRLRPLTEHCPKPLLPLGGKPMVERALAKLYAAGTRRFLINTHHCPEAWTQAFPTGRWQDAEIRFVHEPVLLETGGGLANINQFLTVEDTQLVVWNGDILSDVQLAEAYAHHITNGAEATLVVREKGPNTNVRITDDGFVTDLRDRLGKSDLAYQYTGICFVTRAFAAGVPSASVSLVEHFLTRVQATPGSVQGYLDPSAHWHDLGTVAEYQQVKAEIEKPVRGAIATADAAKLFGYTLTAGEAPIKGGSGRRFHRVAKPDGSTAMLCIYDDARPENLGYGRIGHALFAAGINVPQVLAEDNDAGVLVMEDLGDTDLCTLSQQPTFPWPAVASALEQLGHLHRLGAEAVQTAGVPLMEPFGDKLYAWERQYFTDNVLAGRKLDRDLQHEMATLAKELSGRPQVLVHRDFQSQNILIRQDQAWLIDFQGARLGCQFYDYASLAFDPYLTCKDMDLWRIEIEDHAREVADWKGSLDEFSYLFHIAATQRLLQACGAYAFLGRKQGRADFLAHLPQGLRNLTIAASLCGKRRIARMAEELAGATAVSR